MTLYDKTTEVTELLTRIQELDRREEQKQRIFSRVLRKPALAGLVAVASSLALTGNTYASVPDAGGVIHACYNGSQVPSGLLILDTAKMAKCPGGQTNLTWNQTGPTGPAGPQGLKG